MLKQLVALFFYLVSLNCFSQLVTNTTALQTAISNAAPGSVITLSNGIWTNATINISKFGTASNPITIKAQTAGQVFLEGNSKITMGGAFIKIEGLVFRNPSNLSQTATTVQSVIEFRSSSSVNCHNCSIRNILIENFNGTPSQELLVLKWILLYGQNNEISYCSFIGKKGVGSIVNDNRNDGLPNYHKIHHNYFADRSFVGTYVDQYNDQDAIRIGNSSTSLSNSFTEVYDNLFNNFFGEIEVISNKSGSNKYYQNTFRNYSGTLTLRHGDNSEVYNNFFFANNNQFSGGIRITGENHKIYNNYIERVNSTKSSAAGGGTSSNLGGINVLNGKVNSALNEYYQVKNVLITNNTFVNCDFGVRIGRNGLTEAPQNLTLANNLFFSATNAIDVGTAPTQMSSYQGNIRQGGAWSIPLGNNSIVTSALITQDSPIFRIKSGSAAINAGIGSYPFLTKDVMNGNRDESLDVGAEEFGANGLSQPYNVTDVGSKIGFLGTNAPTNTLLTPQNTFNVYPNPSNDFIQIVSENTIGKVSIIDNAGKLWYEVKVASKSGKINIASLPKGIYYVMVGYHVTKVVLE